MMVLKDFKIDEKKKIDMISHANDTYIKVNQGWNKLLLNLSGFKS